jgi:hypothetical protein
MDEMRTESTWCVSSNREATAAALTKLAGDVSEFCTTMPDVTLEVSGADGDAAAKKLQGIVANVTVTKATPAKAGMMVVAKKKGTPVAQFLSDTTIVPVVHPPTGGDPGPPKVDISNASLSLLLPIPGVIGTLLDISGVVTIANGQVSGSMRDGQSWTSKCKWYGKRACAISVSTADGARFITTFVKSWTYRDPHLLLCYFTSGTKEEGQLDAGSGRFVHYLGTDVPSAEMIKHETGIYHGRNLTWYATDE